MLLGYNTNGLAHHDPLQAVMLLSELGYQSVAITLDHQTLNPYAPQCAEQLAAMRDLLARLGMRSVIETGARYLLDPRTKHEPTLISADPEARARRVEFLGRAVEIAAALGSDCVSLWSGVQRDDAGEEAALARLVAGLRQVINYAGEREVRLGFEPEPGMLIDSMSRYAALLERIDAPHFQLTLDVGHLRCMGELPEADYIRQWGPRLVNIHLEDMRVGLHEHLMFGEGEMDFPPILAAIREVGYQGGVHVELSRHSHEGPLAAQRAMNYLGPLAKAISQ